MRQVKHWLLVGIMSCWGAVSMTAQSVSDELREDVRRAAGMHYALTLQKVHDTPPPAGKQPFYINHYGCPSAYYQERREFYDDPYRTLSCADSLGKLTVMGRKALQKVTQLRNEAHSRTGELTEAGKLQAKELARQLTQRLPEMFTDKSYVDIRSIVRNHCLLTMGEAVLQMSLAHQPLFINIGASFRSQRWMNPQDKRLEALRDDSTAMARYAEFAARWAPDNTHLMTTLFNDADYAQTIDVAELSRQLFDLAGCTQYTQKTDDISLYDVFTPEDIHRHWMRRNAWAYIRYGGCTLNGGHQPYIQRSSLSNLIHQGDSMMTLDKPIVHLRYTQESTVMSLICLLELNGYGLQTGNLDSLEALGWADYRIAPLGGSMMMIHYRTDKNDPDPLVRVLLNGQEARLPIQSDLAPYYHWQDVKRYYLRKLYAYAREWDEE
jgi:hypothetical protein